MNFSGTKLSDDPNDDAAFFKRTQYIKRVYERKFYWYPIYQDQIDKEPDTCSGLRSGTSENVQKVIRNAKEGQNCPSLLFISGTSVRNNSSIFPC